MLPIKQLMLKTSILMFIGALPGLCYAEYYLVYPEPFISDVIEYHSPKPHAKHEKRHTVAYHHVVSRKKRSTYHISVTYYWPICPGCACSLSAPGCYPNDEQMNTRAVTANFVTFSAKPHQGGKLEDERANETYDMRTADDDVMRYPDMNNQYNQF